MASPLCLYTPQRQNGPCSNCDGTGCCRSVRNGNRRPAPTPGPYVTSNGYIKDDYYIRPTRPSDIQLATNGSRNTSRPSSTRSISLPDVNTRSNPHGYSDEEDDGYKDDNIVFVRTSVKSPYDSVSPNVQIFNLQGNKLADDLGHFFSLQAPLPSTPKLLQNPDRNQRSDRVPKSDIYGLATSTRLLSQLLHLREILQMYREYDSSSKSQFDQRIFNSCVKCDTNDRLQIHSASTAITNFTLNSTPS